MFLPDHAARREKEKAQVDNDSGFSVLSPRSMEHVGGPGSIERRLVTRTNTRLLDFGRGFVPRFVPRFGL
jgi:hypothetical protein